MSSIDRTLTSTSGTGYNWSDLPINGETRLITTGGSRWKRPEFVAGSHTHPDLVQPTVISVRTNTVGMFRVNVANTQYTVNPDCDCTVDIGSSPDWTMPVPFTLMYHGQYPVDVYWTLGASIASQTTAGVATMGVIRSEPSPYADTFVPISVAGAGTRALCRHSGVHRMQAGQQLFVVMTYNIADSVTFNTLSLQLVCVRAEYHVEGTQPLILGSRMRWPSTFSAFTASKVQASICYQKNAGDWGTINSAPATNITSTGFDLVDVTNIFLLDNKCVLPTRAGVDTLWFGTRMFFHPGWARYIVVTGTGTTVSMAISDTASPHSWSAWHDVLTGILNAVLAIVVVRHTPVAAEDRLFVMARMVPNGTNNTVYFRRTATNAIPTAPANWSTQGSFSLGTGDIGVGLALGVKAGGTWSLAWGHFHANGTNATTPVFSGSHAILSAVNPVATTAVYGAVPGATHLGFPGSFSRGDTGANFFFFANTLNPTSSANWSYYLPGGIGTEAAAWTYSASLGYLFIYKEAGQYVLFRLLETSLVHAGSASNSQLTLSSLSANAVALGNLQLSKLGQYAAIVFSDTNTNAHTLMVVKGPATSCVLGTDVFLHPLESNPGRCTCVTWTNGDSITIHRKNGAETGYLQPYVGQARFRAIK